MSIIVDIERSGWTRSANPECGVERSDSMNSWTCCNTCVSKRGGNCSRKVGNMPSPRSCGRSLIWDRFDRHWRWHSSRLRIVSAASDNCGLIADWPWRPASVRNTAWSKVRCGVRRNCFPFGPGQRPQPRSEGSIQRSGHHGQYASRTVPGFVPSGAGQRHQADHGASHAGPQDCSDYADSVEEGRELRRRKTKIASRLSVSGEEPLPSPVIFFWWWPVGSETLGCEGEYDYGL